MRDVLLKLGVPESAITLDPAGFRTLDSVVRARDVYGQRRLTVITDHFHSYRTVFLARHYGMDVVAFPERGCGIELVAQEPGARVLRGREGVLGFLRAPHQGRARWEIRWCCRCREVSGAVWRVPKAVNPRLVPTPPRQAESGGRPAGRALDPDQSELADKRDDHPANGHLHPVGPGFLKVHPGNGHHDVHPQGRASHLVK